MRRGWLAVATGTVIILLLVALLPRRLVNGYSPQSQAIAAVRTTHTAQTQYFSQLRPLCHEPAGAPWLSDDLVYGAEGGYRFTLTGTESGYPVSAIPAFPHSGSRSFYSDQTMVVHEHIGRELATQQDPESK